MLTPEQRQLIDQQSSYPMICCAPIGFGAGPKFDQPGKFNSASITLLRLSGRQIGVTNFHVLDAYRARLHQGEKVVCQIGNVSIDPMAYLVSESSQLDLAVLDLSSVNASKIRGGTDMPCQFLEPTTWPPPMPSIGSFIMFGGFPGVKRVHHAPDTIEFGSMSSGGTEVISVQDDLIICQIQIERCKVSLDHDGCGIGDLGGLSGCPVLLPRYTPIAVMDLVGVVFEYHAPWDVLRIRPLSLIREDGSIVA